MAGKGRAADLEEIRAISDRAQTVWYALLAAFLYLAITVASVSPADFFFGNREIALPIVSVAVPTATFFVIAPMLAAILFTHFHLFQIRLWRTLGRVAADGPEGPLPDWVPPWQLTNAALVIRSRLRAERAGEEVRTEPFAMLAAAMTILSAWGFGVAVLAYTWWAALASRNALIIAAATVAAALTLAAAVISFWIMWRAMRGERQVMPGWAAGLAWQVLAAAGAGTCLILVAGSLRLAETRPLDLRDLGRDLIPEGWLPEDIAFREFAAEWCEREGIAPCDPDADALTDEWTVRRALEVERLPHPFTEPDPQPVAADLTNAFLDHSEFEGADFSGSDLSGASLRGVRARDTSLAGAVLINTDLSNALLQGVDLTGTLIMGGRFPCRTEGVAGPDLACGDEAEAHFILLINGVADDRRAGGIRSDFPGDPRGGWGGWRDTTIVDARAPGAALRFMDTEAFVATTGDMGHASFEDAGEVFADGTVLLTSPFDSRPCHWSDRVLSDRDFFGHWRGFRAARGLADWPPSAAIGDLSVASNRYLDAGEGSVQVVPRRIRVSDIPAITMPRCTDGTPVPCLGGIEDAGSAAAGARTCSAAP